MPGVLKRSPEPMEDTRRSQGPERENYAVGSTNLKRPFDQVDDTDISRSIRNDEPPSKRQMVNGDTVPVANGILTNGDHHTSVLVSHEEIAQTINEVNAPPELYHVQDNIVPLSLIWERMAQEAHVELEELIANLSNIPPPQINGYPHHKNDGEMEKKNKIWDFAHKWRAKFIQLGVLTTWSTNAEAVGKMIDISFYLTGQRTHHREFVKWMGELKRQLSYESVPAPDLQTALEVLSTGKAQWVSHLGYITEKPLSPKQLLKSLKTLNTVLTVRLTTQQEIPHHLSRWTVKDGRVTFVVKDEFELDLAIASEDPASQFYFIDLRFLFSPSKKRLPMGPTKSHVEWRVNDILLREGLQACYEFLHELVLEHKLTIFRDQARKMVTGQWNDNARLCKSNRGIVVQYWTNRPGRKSWIEIAVNSGKTRGVVPTGLETPHLNLRWHRHGVDVVNHGIEIDVGHLSLERILTEVIAHHTNHIFKSTKRKLKQSPIYSNGSLTLKHRAHPFDSRDCLLKVQLSKEKTISIYQDAVSGTISATPTSHLIWSTMVHANNSPDPAAHLPQQLGILRCNIVLEDAVFQAKKFGWQVEPVEALNNETKARLFKSERIRYQFFYVPGWPLDWYLVAFTTTMEGDNIWLIEQQDKTIQPSFEDLITGRHQRFKSSVPIKMKKDEVQLLSLNKSRLFDIEKHSAILVSQRQDCKWLRENKTDIVQKPSSQIANARSGNPQIYIKYPFSQGTRDNKNQSWCTNTVKICYMGLAPSRSDLVTFVTGHFRKSNQQLQAGSLSKQDSLMFNPAKNAFTFRVQTPLGVSTMDAADAKLNRLGALIGFLDTTERFGFVCEELSLDKITFKYSLINPVSSDLSLVDLPKATFSASISFLGTSEMQVSFSEGNPHLLTKDYLNEEINKPNGLTYVAGILCNTLSLVQSLSAISDLHFNPDSKVSMAVVARSCASFQVRYLNKTVLLRFEVSLRFQGELKLHIAQASGELQAGVAIPKKREIKELSDEPEENNTEAQPQPLLPEDLQKFWETLVRPRGVGWNNLGKGIICEISSIDACLRHLDGAITAFFSAAADPEPERLSVPQTQPSHSSNNKPTTTSPQQAKTPQLEETKISVQGVAGASAAAAVTKSTPATQPSVSRLPAGAQNAPQAAMSGQQNRMGAGNMQHSAQNRGVNMNFKPGLGQQMPTANAMAALQAQHRNQLAQGYGTPPANVAQMRPGGNTGGAPQANMQGNMHNRRPVGPNNSPPKQANNGQNKNQPITLE